MAFLTDAEVAQWVRIADPSATPLLSMIAEAACAAVEEFCDRSFTPGQRTETYDGTDHYRLILRQWPVASVQVVSIGGVALAAQVAVNDGGWVLDNDRELLRPGSRWTPGKANVSVTYTLGAPPAPVKMAALITAQALFNARSADPNVASESAGNYSANYWSTGPGSVPPAARTMLSGYRSVFKA